MKKELSKYSNTYDKRFNYYLELTDFDYLKDEFIAVKDNLGFTLTSIKKPKLSIHIGQNDIKYDNDIAERRMFIAVERISIPIRLLTLDNDSDYWKAYMPTTADNLYKLINEFKYSGFGNVKGEEIIEFLLAEPK